MPRSIVKVSQMVHVVLVERARPAEMPCRTACCAAQKSLMKSAFVEGSTVDIQVAVE